MQKEVTREKNNRILKKRFLRFATTLLPVALSIILYFLVKYMF